MKYIKKYESEKQFREVNLQDLYDDFQHFKLKLGYTSDNVRNNFVSHVLSPLLLNKEIEFHKTKSPLDDEPRWGFSGEVSSVGLKTSGGDILIVVTLYGNKKGPYPADQLILTKLDLVANQKRNKFISKIVKIYDSEETEFEETVKELKIREKMEKDVEKYNL